MHKINQRPGVVHRRLLQDAVAEVEDVARATGGGVEDGLRLAADRFAIGQ
jgi:hypothetical protein